MRGAVAVVYGIDVGEDQEHVRADLPRQDRRDAVLVGDGVDPLEPQHGVFVDRRPSAAARHHDVARRDQVPDHVVLHHRGGLGARREAAPAPRLLLLHRHAVRFESRQPHGVEGVTDRLDRDPQVRVVRVAQRLGHERNHLARHARAGERILERLLDHVAHPAGGCRHEDAEGKRLNLVRRDLVPRELVAHLRPVAVHQGDGPPGAREVHDRRQAFARVTELVRDRGPLSRRRDRVAAQRDDDSARCHGGAT